MTVPLPVPLLPEVMEIHDEASTETVAVQVQAEEVATDIASAPADVLKVLPAGEIV